MNSGRFVLSQVLDQVHRQALERCAQRYNANDRVRHFGCRQQFTAMAFAQMTWREGLSRYRGVFECQTRGSLSSRV
jgi:hypothetical protein